MAEEIIKEFPVGTPAEVKLKETEGLIRKKVIVYPDKLVYILEKPEKKESKETKKPRGTKRKRSSSS